MANLSACRAGMWVLLVSGLGGCQTGGNTELLERQLRIQEDRIYQLEDELERHCKMVQACRKENQTLKASSAPAAASQPAAATPNSLPPAQLPADLTPPKIELDLPPVPPPSSSSGAEPILPGPRLDAPTGSEPVASTSRDGSTLQIRTPAAEKPSPHLKGATRVVDQSAGSNVAPQAYYEPVDDSAAARSSVPPAARRPQWSPYR